MFNFIKTAARCLWILTRMTLVSQGAMIAAAAVTVLLNLPKDVAVPIIGVAGVYGFFKG
jgi:hypothetical protein